MAAVKGIDPSVLIAPDYQTQQLQAERRLALADALRQQAMADTPGNGGNISWTQGLARVLDAWSSAANAKRGYAGMKSANQGYAAGVWNMFHPGVPYPGASQTAHGAPPAPSGTPTPQMAPQAPQQAPPPQQAPVPGQPPFAGQAAQPLPDNAPPQAAPPPPPANAAPSPQSGGASPFSLTGDPQRDMTLYMMDPQSYTQQLAAVAGKGATPTDEEIAMAHARTALEHGDVGSAQAILSKLHKDTYIPPISGRPGGWTIYPDGHKEYNPQAPAPGAMPVMDAKGQPTGAWSEDPSAADIQAHQAGAVAGAQAGAKAPYDTVQTYNTTTGQMEIRPKSDVTGGGLNQYYGHGASQAGHGGVPTSGAMPAGPALGQQAGFEQYAKHSADAFAETQSIADSSPQRVQSLREMQGLISGPGALNTGPTAAKVQHIAEEHGLTFLAHDNAFVFNKDAARFVAQSAADLGLNGSDARLGMMANASPNMKMTPQALKVVIPTMIGLEYAKMAKATAASNWAQRDPGGNAKFESQWRQAYDPRMFTAYAEGGPQALAHAPANLRQQWLKDYRTLKSMGVNFTQFAQ